MASTAWLGSPRHRPTRCAASGGDARPETAPAAAPPPDPARPPPLPPYTLPPGVSPVLIARPADVRDAADMLHAAPVVGMDCEWGPDPPGGGRPGRGRRRPARYAPVETLQLATAGAAFVFDVRALREEGAGGDALEALLAPLFRAPAPLLAGHSLRGDLARLAATLPHLTVFGGGGGGGGRPAPLVGHVDLVLLSRAAAAATAAAPSAALASSWPVPSLAKLTAAALGAHLDKAVRRSDWTARPLSPAQLAYAAADAHVCVELFGALASARAWGDGAPDLAASPAWLAFLANGVKDAAGGRGGGSASRPRPAAGPGSGAGWRERARARAEDGPVRLPPRAPAAQPPAASRPPPARETTVDVAALLEDFLGVPLPAGGRPAVTAAAAGLLRPGAGADAAAAAARAAPPAPRGGVLEFANACALLINLPGHDGGAPRGPPRLYSNAFFRLGDDRGGGGLAVSWWPSPGQGRAARLTRRLLGPEGDGVGAEAPVLLFARLAGGKKSAYVLLGRLEAAAVDWTAAHGGGEVAWRLVDVDAARARGGRTVAALLEAGGLDV